ncbi:hypothetical protein L7F22_024730 [Adiantum nelumboides]|nr:hypothetical protein [Adiantum nelumboides]
MPSLSTSSSDKSYDIIELEGGDLELHEVQKPQQTPSPTPQLMEITIELPSMEVDKEKMELVAEIVVQAKEVKDRDTSVQENVKEMAQEPQGELVKSPVKDVEATQEIELEKSPPRDTLKEKEQSPLAAASIEVAAQQPQAWDILAGLYAGCNEAKIALLHKDLESTIMNEEDDMETFLVGVKDINEKLIYAGVAENSQSWREIKQAVKEMYLPPAHETLKMNEFFALKQQGLSLVKYYSKFVSLRRYAPAMTIEQQVAQFCQGLNKLISSRLEAMKPITVQDALLQAKLFMKEQSVIGQRKRFEPNQSSNGPRQQSRRNFANPQHHRAYTANVQNSLRSDIRCFEYNELEHYCNRCPHLAHRTAAAAESGPRRPGGRNTRRGCGRGRAARIFGRDQGRNAHAHAAFGNPTLGKRHERATVYATIDNPVTQRQFAVIQTLATHQGKRFNFLIDCGRTHSFLSPKCLQKLQLNQQSYKPMLVELANGKTVISRHSAGTLKFELGEHSTSTFFRTLPFGVYDGILGMDWLSKSQASIHCGQGSVTFRDDQNQQVKIKERVDPQKSI